MNRTIAAVAVAVAVILPSCAGEAARSGRSDVPSVARVVCTQDGTRVETPEVRPQPNGVHVVIDNRIGFHTGISARYSNGASAGRNASQGESEHVLTAPPGTLEIGCYTDRAALESDLETLQVEDPSGIYRSTELDCDATLNGVSDYVAGATGKAGDPVDLARERLDQVTGLRDDDTVEVAGYPEDVVPAVRLVRDDRVLATITYHPDGQGGWLEEMLSRCDELIA